MGYYRTMGALPASLTRGAATGPVSSTTGQTVTSLPNLVVRRNGVTTTYTPSQAVAAGYVWVKTPAPGRWERKTAAGGDTVTSVTVSPTHRSRCQAAGLYGAEAEQCAAALAEGKGFEKSVCIGAGVTGWLQQSVCEVGLKNGKSLAEVLAQTKTPAVVRDTRYQTLVAECAAAGVPESHIDACVAARQSGASLEESAGAAIAAASKRKMLMLAGLGAAGLVGFFYWKKRKGKKK